MKISHRPLSKRLRIWQRRPSHRLKSPTTETRARVRRPEREQHAADAFVRRDLRAEPLVELPVRALEQQMIVDAAPAPGRRRRRPRRIRRRRHALDLEAVGAARCDLREQGLEEIALAPLELADRRAVAA